MLKVTHHVGMQHRPGVESDVGLYTITLMLSCAWV